MPARRVVTKRSEFELSDFFFNCRPGSCARRLLTRQLLCSRRRFARVNRTAHSRGACAGRAAAPPEAETALFPRDPHTTTQLLCCTSCGQIERRIRAAPPGALASLSRFPFRAQAGHEALAILIGRLCQDGGLGNENFDPDLCAALIPTLETVHQRAKLDAIKIAFELVRQEKAALLVET